MIPNLPRTKKVKQQFQTNNDSSGEDRVETEDGRVWRSTDTPASNDSGSTSGELIRNGNRTGIYYERSI